MTDTPHVRRIWFTDDGFNALLTLMTRMGMGSPSLTVERLIFQAMKVEADGAQSNGRAPGRR